MIRKITLIVVMVSLVIFTWVIAGAVVSVSLDWLPADDALQVAAIAWAALAAIGVTGYVTYALCDDDDE